MSPVVVKRKRDMSGSLKNLKCTAGISQSKVTLWDYEGLPGKKSWTLMPLAARVC